MCVCVCVCVCVYVCVGGCGGWGGGGAERLEHWFLLKAGSTGMAGLQVDCVLVSQHIGMFPNSVTSRDQPMITFPTLTGDPLRMHSRLV